MGIVSGRGLDGQRGDLLSRRFLACRDIWHHRILRFTCLVVFFSLGGSVAPATASDPFDLASINLHPVYFSPSNSRPAATLHAVATSGNPSAPISIAVGDGGTILRSTDGGQTWNPMDRMTPLAESPADNASTLRFGAKRPTRRFTAIALWHFYDVAWLSSLDVIIVGGAFEPVTGISRGVCLVSDDAGETWSMGNAHELPRLKRIIRPSGRPVGTVEAVGDASEASGMSRFLSYDAGRSWVEANTVVDESRERLHHEGRGDWSTVNRRGIVSSSTANGLIRVGQYGQIAVRSNGQWQTVRGDGRHAAVAIVAASPRSVVWSLAGRESLHENRRVVLALSDPTAAERTAQRVADAAKLIGVSVCDHLHGTDPSKLQQWLVKHRPAVVVLDNALDDAQHRSWVDAIARTRQASSAGNVYPQRVLIYHAAHEDTSKTRHPSIWKRSSVLRADALLTGPATLAGDFVADASMIAAAGCPTPASVEVATLDDLSGTVRRDIALTSGLTLREGQTRIGEEVYVAANRRLQIATARATQTANLQNQLAALIERGSRQDESTISAMIQGVLAVTAPEDRTRLLWGQLTQIMRARNVTDAARRPGFATVRNVLLKQLGEHASPASIRRWADWTRAAVAMPLRPIAANDIPELAQAPTKDPHYETSNPTSNPTSNAVSTAMSHAGARSRALSPFQVKPVGRIAPNERVTPAGYETSSGLSSLKSVAPTTILIPQTKSTVWQSTRGLHGSLVSPMPGPRSSDRSPTETTQRINWDFHPVVMAGRKIDLADRSYDRPQVPSTAQRPMLDGDFSDTCWRDGLVVRDDDRVTTITRDTEYWYFAIAHPQSAGVLLQLDCEGNYVSPVEFQIDPSGHRRVTSDTGRLRDPRWYVASDSTSMSNATQNNHQRTEIAISRSDLPGPIYRVAVKTVAPNRPRVWQAMPDPRDWLSVMPNGLE